MNAKIALNVGLIGAAWCIGAACLWYDLYRVEGVLTGPSPEPPAEPEPSPSPDGFQVSASEPTLGIYTLLSDFCPKWRKLSNRRRKEFQDLVGSDTQDLCPPAEAEAIASKAKQIRVGVRRFCDEWRDPKNRGHRRNVCDLLAYGPGGRGLESQYRYNSLTNDCGEYGLCADHQPRWYPGVLN